MIIINVLESKTKCRYFLGSNTLRKTLFRKVICELQLSSVLWLKQLTHYQIQDVNVLKQKTTDNGLKILPAFSSSRFLAASALC
jgi:hypothetical protein